MGCAKYFEKNKVYYHTKRGQNKAAIAEHFIFLLKRKIYLTIRHLDFKEWETVVEQCVKNLNGTARKALGGLRPKNLIGDSNAVLIDQELGFSHEPKYSDHIKNEEKFKKTTDLNIGDFVYVSPNKPLRSFEIQVY